MISMVAIKGHFDGKVIVPDEPLDLRPGQRLVVRIEEDTPTTSGGGTAADLLNSPLVGLWKDRTDITDSAEYARQLRRRAETRGDRS